MKLEDVVRVTEQRQVRKQKKAGNEPVAEVQIKEEFELTELSDEEIKASKEEAEENKRLAESLGKQEVAIRGMLENLLGKNPEWKLLSGDNVVRKEIERLHSRLEELGSMSGSLGEHKDFAAFIAGIRETDTESDIAVGFVMNRLVRDGYYKPHFGEKPPKWPAGTIFLYDKIYISCRNEDGSATSRQRAVEAEVRKMTDAHKKTRVAKVKGGNTKLDQFVKTTLAADYTFYSPVRTVSAKGGRPAREEKEGWALVRLENVNKGEKGKKAHYIFDILDAIGSCAWLARDGNGKRRMPHFWLLVGRPITKYENRMPEDEFKRTRAKIGALRGMIWAWCEGEGKDDEEKVKVVRDLLETEKFKKTSKKS